MAAKDPDTERSLRQWRDAYRLYRAAHYNDHLAALSIAEDLLRKPWQTAAQRSKLHGLVADIYAHRLERREDALRHYRLALQDDPENTLAACNLGQLYVVDLRDYTSAIDVLQGALHGHIESDSLRACAERWLHMAREHLAA